MQSVLAGMGMSLAAMGAAAAGLLPAVWGALLQEGIDVAVIRADIEQLRVAADALTAEPRAAMARVRQAYALLTGESGRTRTRRRQTCIRP